LKVILKLDNLLIRVEVNFSLGCDDHPVLPEQFLHVKFRLQTRVQFVAWSFNLLKIVEGVKHPLVVSKAHGVLGEIVKNVMRRYLDKNDVWLGDSQGFVKIFYVNVFVVSPKKYDAFV